MPGPGYPALSVISFVPAVKAAVRRLSLPNLGRRGSVGIMAGVAIVPLLASAGAGLDMARLTLAKTALQTAVDEAALAGAAAYQSDTQAGTGTSTATTYFNRDIASMSGLVTINSVTVTPAVGTNAQGYPAYTINVSVSATMSYSLMTVMKLNLATVTAQATAANPMVQPVITVGAIKSSAWDWNSVYMYAVPNGSNGKPDYTLYPPVSQAFEVGSNCNSNSVAYIANTADQKGNNGNGKGNGNGNKNGTSNGSRCIGQFGEIVPNPQGFPVVTATQKLAFMLVNMTLGVGTTAAQGGGNNMYGAAPGNFELVSTAPLSLGQGPASITDTTPAIIQQLTGTLISQPGTHYTKTLSQTTPNCAVQIQIVDPNNLPAAPPVNGRCFSLTDPAAGSQYANFSCADMAGRTFMYWFNDMGGGVDDYDYNDFYFTVRCVPGTASPNGGTVQNTNVPTGNITVGLVK